MSNHSTPAHGESTDVDVVESIVPLMPIVLPVGGGILIFLLAFIAVFMSCARHDPPPNTAQAVFFCSFF